MTVQEAIMARSSVHRYKPDPVPKNVLQRILKMASHAPSWGNRQCWRFIVVDDPTNKAFISKETADPRLAQACEEAPCLIVLCAVPSESLSDNGIDYYVFDAALAMENLVLAAATEGLGTCILGSYHEGKIKRLLGVPKAVRVVAITPLGYPAETPVPTSRKPLSEQTYRNGWGSSYR
jgi:nitroreductase